MNIKTERWLRGLGAAIISGLANSFLNALGISGAQAIGINIQQLNARQLVGTTVIGGLVGLAFYLLKSPLPPGDEA